ncbi:MAG: hydrogenase formation protein HypD, partial [Candidatus Brocadiia bacterium]
MKYVDEYRDPDAARSLAARIAEAAEGQGPMRLMEVCGGHTMAIHRFGIPHLLPESVELLSGPGCPVCVTPTTYIDRALELAETGATLVTFGDLYRVPGAERSLEDGAAAGLDVRVAYSARDALQTAAENPDLEVVFLAIGFETTAPGTAATLSEAREKGIANFRVLCGHKVMPPALLALLEAPEVA